MRVPSIPYREPMDRHEIGLDAAAVALLGAGLVMSITVWALAIAKLIDLCAGW